MYFFDLDGTLLDSNGIWLDIDIEFLGRRGISPVPEDYTDYVTHHSAPDAARYTRERFSLPETPEEIMARALLVAKDTMKRKEERIRQLEKKVETVVKENNKLRPKADFMDKVMDADERIDIGQSAKILNLPFGRNTLFQKLREMGVFFKNKNEPKQEYVKRGYFVLKENWIDRNNHDGFMVLKVLVTQKGLEFLANLFKVVEKPKEIAEMI